MELKEALLKRRSVRKFTKMQAPLAIIVCGNLSHALPLKMADYWIQDCSAATENILLRVSDLGLGAVWCGIYPQKRAEEKVKKILDIPENQIPLNIIFIGHPNEYPEARDQYDETKVHYVK